MASKNDDDNDLLEEDKKEDRILDCAIHYVLNKTYPCELEKDKKRAVRERAATLVFRGWWSVCPAEEQESQGD